VVKTPLDEFWRVIKLDLYRTFSAAGSESPYVYSVTEQGVGSDAGWTRLTFRYRARSWCVVVYPDGTLVEGPATAGHGLFSMLRR